MDENPFPDFKIDSAEFLNEIEGRSKCPKCTKSRKFYCYACYVPLGGEQFESRIPRVKLPVKIDILKHPQEVDGKSTAVHAAILAPDDVCIYIYPTIPEYDPSKVLLVYPGPEAIEFEQFIKSYLHSIQEKNRAGTPHEPQVKANSSDVTKSETNASNSEGVEEISNRSHTTANDSASQFETNGVEGQKVDVNLSSCLNQSTDSNAIHTTLTEQSPRLKTPEIPFERVVFIDSTWHTVYKICSDSRLKGLKRIELKTNKTKFWRHQKDKPDTYLATIEAIYYFLREFDEYVTRYGTDEYYKGQFDNLLFYFCFSYHRIRQEFEGGKQLKAYNQERNYQPKNKRRKKASIEERKDGG